MLECCLSLLANLVPISLVLSLLSKSERHVAAENNTDTSQFKATRFPNTRSASRIQNSEKTLKSKNQPVFDRVNCR